MTSRFSGLLSIMAASLSLSGCAENLRSQPPPMWTTGFWYWHGNSAEAAPAKVVPHALFVHSGKISEFRGSSVPGQWVVSDEMPDSLPAARAYWLVFRKEEAGVPDVLAAPVLVSRISSLLSTARRRQVNVVGVQLDIDSPTAELSRYAAFLREVRRTIPAGLEISITALLDWFREGTSIADVIKETDEFVPQFYDVALTDSVEKGSIAAEIDPARWGPIFNRFGKRFRIGISAFGRAQLLPRQNASPSRYAGFRFYGDLTPLDIASNPAFELRTSHSEAHELVLSYRPTRNVRIAYNDFQPGDLIRFVLPTPEGIRAAVGSSKRMRGHCAGIVFFRWPASDENMVMQPDDVMAAAGLAPRGEKMVGIETADGHCAAVSCVDLYLVNATPLSAQAIRYRIRSSTELQYFLPETRVPARMAGPSDLELTLPAYSAQNRMLLGRAVTANPAAFRVEEVR